MLLVLLNTLVRLLRLLRMDGSKRNDALEFKTKLDKLLRIDGSKMNEELDAYAKLDKLLRTEGSNRNLAFELSRSELRLDMFERLRLLSR